ncbi:uncharacterized protein BP01DRAFT_353925 [Aspergillus saccharolyticus JOP 1030-1]|uniref:Uncharacterized protein n=1 Tax=Aspergillus saccharolyticus JOP 1030-1 TaxID=1450539 RepID=A0A319ANA0_9EURO|nr:hypothetical protein BP01DRAFT_353925 [Aspergillus saccharolyticus JOP 1030-1]PYH48042.1 hypothetical protein BP01DRAFT_353925 [Aspergillus saccharolyticus JOP 1030-1]
MNHQFFATIVALCVYAHWALAALTASQIANSLNELAQEGFAAKDLVLEINSTADASPIRDVYAEMDTIVIEVLQNVNFMTNTPVITDQAEQQSVYEGYSNFVQSLLELMDAFSSTAARLKSLDATTKTEVPGEVRTLESAVDAYFYNIIGLFPANSSYNTQANNQKAQVDTHCFQAIWAFDSSAAAQSSIVLRREGALGLRRGVRRSV